MEALTKGLPQENCYVNVLRDAMAVDSLDGCGVYFGTTGGRCMLRRMREIAGHDCAGFAGGALGRGADAAVSRIRIELPYHLRTLAEVRGEVELEVTGAVTQRSILDALETKYPVLRGTIRDHGTYKGGRFCVFRVFGGLVARIGGCAAARSCGLRQRTLLIVGAIAGVRQGHPAPEFERKNWSVRGGTAC